MKGLWLYLHFPQLQLDSLLAQQAYASELALVIVNSANMQVVQLNSSASQAGIRTGMSIAAAATLCPSLQVQDYQAKVEQDARINVADKLYTLTSDICFFADSGLLLRVHTMLQLYAGLTSYWLAIEQQLSSLNVSYHYAIANTPLAAKLLALNQWNTVTDDERQIAYALQHCPLQLTDLDDKAVHKLKRIGVNRLAQLMTMPLTDIGKRFSYEVAEYLGRLSGELPQPVAFYHPQQNFERYLELLYEATDSQQLIPPLEHLLTALQQFLTLRDQVTLAISICLHQREHPALRLKIGSQQGEYRCAPWLVLMRLQLENLSLDAPVYGITLSSGETHLRCPQKADLFAAKQAELTRLQLIALLQAKLGTQAVRRPVFNDEHRPESANQSTAFSQLQAHKVTPLAMRPVFLLPEPTPLTQKVSIEHGPERIQSGWWDKHPVERDYFVARNQQGQWYWIFRTSQQQWFLHGVFS